MIIRDLFAKPIDRPIEGVIKADDESHLTGEVEEYIVTNEIARRLDTFFDAYNQGDAASGVWISGFFGSGKSHLLKMLSLALENREIDGAKVGDLFARKVGEQTEDALLTPSVEKAVKIPSQSILFNIDQKADVINKQETDALLAVFLKVFNEMLGYYPKQPYIAQFERDLDKRNLLTPFKTAFEKEAGEPWEDGRETAHGLDSEPFARAYAEATGASYDEGLKVLDRYYQNYRLSIEDFANLVKEYIDEQESGFRLNFFVDEVGQFIADNAKLMVNLQTIAESLTTKCQGRSWLVVTSQEDMSTVVGEMARIHTSTDFSKIQDRFKVRLPLTSKDVAEVIQKRLLDKKKDAPEVAEELGALYEREKANFRTLFEFGDDTRQFKVYSDQGKFIESYPFVPYQYDLFQLAINDLSRHNAFTGKHAAVGERSMLGVFQQVAKIIADRPLGALASFDLMFEGIRAVIKREHQAAILMAENNLGNQLAERILKALFLVKYLKEFKGTPRNIAILVIDSFDIDLAAHEKAVREALNILEQNTYVQRTGEAYQFLTDDEKDVENEIKATEVDDSAINEMAARVVFDDIIRETKIRHEEHHQDYTYSRKLDGALFGREHELAVNVISPFHEHHGDEATLISQSMGRSELLLLLPSDQRLLSDLNLYTKTDKFIRQNTNATLSDSRRRILNERAQQNTQRKKDIGERVARLLSQSKAVVNGSEVTGLPSDPRSRVIKAFQHLLRYAYPNLKMLRVVHTEEGVRNILTEQGDDLFRHDEDTLSESEQEILTHIRRRQSQGERPTVGSILQIFAKAPYGWYQAATLANLAKLFMRSKVELRADSNILDKQAALEALTNSRQFNNTIVFLQEEFDAAAIQKLKKFHQELFDEANPATEAKDVAERFQAKLKAEVALLEEIRRREQSFPFVLKLDGPLQSFRPWTEKAYSVFLKELSTIQEEWLDAKEDVIDPIRKFVDGRQGQVYQEIRAFARDNKQNIADIAPEETRRLDDFLAHNTPYRGDALQKAKSLTDKLREQVSASLKEARDDASSKVKKLAANIETLDGFAELADEEKQEVFTESNRVLDTIRDATLLAVVRDALHRYTTESYQRQLEILNTLVARKAKQQGVEEPAAQFVTRTSIPIHFDKKVIATEADLEEYLEAVRKAYTAALREKKRITL